MAFILKYLICTNEAGKKTKYKALGRSPQGTQTTRKTELKLRYCQPRKYLHAVNVVNQEESKVKYSLVADKCDSFKYEQCLNMHIANNIIIIIQLNMYII